MKREGGFDEGKDGRVKNNHLVFMLGYRTHKSLPDGRQALLLI